MKPAIAFLVNRRLINASAEMGMYPWNRFWIGRTPATRRFVRGRPEAERGSLPSDASDSGKLLRPEARAAFA